MNLTLALSLAVCLVGAVVYLLSPAKAAELGRLAFACALLAFLLQFSAVLSLTAR